MRRILFLDHPEPTFGSSFLWHGLKELERKSQGSIEMTLYPYLPTHFEAERFDLRELPWYWWLADLVRKSKYGGEPLSYGIPQFGMNENLTYTGKVNDIAFSTPRLRFPETNIIYDEDHIVSEMQQRPFDLIVLGNSHRVPTILLSRLKERMRKLPPIIYLDAGERDELNEHWVHVFRPAVIFKEHLTPAVEARGLTVKIPNYKFKIYPLPLSQPIANHASLVDTGGTNLGALQTISTVMKERQVFYWLGPTWPLRKKALDVLDSLMKRKGEAVSSVEDYPEYHRMLALSRMGVSMRGSGRDTTRYWEVPLYRTVLVADGTMGCIHPHAFEHEKNALFYKTLQELEGIVERNMSDYPLLGDLEPIARAGQEHLKRYHSSLARAIFFLERIQENVDILDGDILATLRRVKVDLGWDDQIPWRSPVSSCEGA